MTPLINGVPFCQVSYRGKPGRKGCRHHAEVIISTERVASKLACPRHLHRVMLQMKQNPQYFQGVPFTVTFTEE